MLRRFVAAVIILSVLSVANSFAAKPLKVYILAGQSNMTGMAKTDTLEHIKMFPETANEFADLFDQDGTPVVLDEVYVSCWPKTDYELKGKLKPGYGGGSSWDRIGPEYAFGIYMHKQLNEPILIIKTAQGGRNLSHNFRPPSAGQWTPPAGHPDLVKQKHPVIPLPEKLDLPADYVPPRSLVPENPGRGTGKYMGIKPVRGVAIGEISGVHPIYLTASPNQEFPGTPFQKGDLIIGVDGQGLRQDPVEHWREAFWGSHGKDADWMITVTRWRNGKIDTFDFDIAELDKVGGRENLETYLAAEEEKSRQDPKAIKGYYYDKMIEHVSNVLKDVKRYHPGYDEKAGYELAGFVWFQGYNDLVDAATYPNRDKPRGYEQYTWLLEHFIRDVRKDLDAPDMPFVIGVLGVGGVEDPPTSNAGYFQQAQAAVADNPEFKGTVAAVHTGKYWDHKLAAADEKSRELNRTWRGKDRPRHEGEAEPKTFEEFRALHMTPEEVKMLTGISDQGYHYFGSAKIMAGIGKGFAEAMLELQKTKP